MTNKKDDVVIDFMRFRFFATILSLLLVLGSFVSLAVKGVNWGLDFTGGTLVELVFEKSVSPEVIRGELARAQLDDVVVQEFGSEKNLLIRIPGEQSGVDQKITNILDQQFDFSIKRVEFVGPQVGEQLREQGGLGMLLALGMVMLYVAFRFQFKFSVGAVVALAHDSIIAMGLFSILELPFDLTVLAAILALIGYSLNDTIIIYDRVRENFRKLRTASPEEIINRSLTQTLGRTLATSGTTLMVLLALFFFGGEMIKGFSSMLIAGVVIGTYSSIYIASNLLIYMKVSSEDLIVVVNDQDAENEMP